MTTTFRTLAKYTYSSEAQIIKGRLEADGVQVFLSDHITINTDPLVSNAIGGVKLKVLSSQFDEAKDILDAIETYSINDEGNAIHCPNCQSDKVELFSSVKDFKSLFWFIFGLLFSTLPFYTKYKYKCENCKTEFNLE
ncbi:putative signal transducing protein [Seonamhaeicola aphaedonensis]|uniref:Putative signal transducing protein n=1 Tax=Seonamhaeicola aphaedonensis TaxID=1461338 RepID=A0A3D9HGY6_9FLAO|nr:DUF2007 domain-containing protein [Seonamhaeicola aphaedonensis]RED48769.1 putative signal transducing protein [Seonamhaeicola aphaedonensis]